MGVPIFFGHAGVESLSEDELSECGLQPFLLHFVEESLCHLLFKSVSFFEFADIFLYRFDSEGGFVEVVKGVRMGLLPSVVQGFDDFGKVVFELEEIAELSDGEGFDSPGVNSKGNCGRAAVGDDTQARRLAGDPK